MVKIMVKLRTYAILTTDSDRIEVKAYNIVDAYRKAKKKLIIFKLDKFKSVSKDANLTPEYETFGRDGINVQGFIITKSSRLAYEKYKL